MIPRRRHVALSSIATCLATLAAVSPVSGEKFLGTRIAPGAETRVFVFAAFDANCQPLAAPRLVVEAAPGKGTVEFRDGLETTVQYSLSGRCVGKRVNGTGVFYKANKDGEGADAFTVSARMSGGEVATRSFHLRIAP